MRESEGNFAKKGIAFFNIKAGNGAKATSPVNFLK